MKLLENPLIQKYFGYKPGEVIPCDNPHTFCVQDRMSYRILQAMCEPIKKGEKYLRVDGVLGITVTEMRAGDTGFWKDEMKVFGYHSHMLRLPDQFQSAFCDCKKPNPVESKIKEICDRSWGKTNDDLNRIVAKEDLEVDLRILVNLARRP